MHLFNETLFILDSLDSLLSKMSEKEYYEPISILQNKSVSQHVRHILEFYQEFLLGHKKGEIDYDARKRSLKIESDRNYTIEFIQLMRIEFSNSFPDKTILLHVSSHKLELRSHIQSSLYRELSYCNEHSIHHMAIIKMALFQSFPRIQVSDGFGVAYATQFLSKAKAEF
ncbi:DinB family protein [Leptospira ryugenii]|uniref:DinB family protein n=1 Tax=Leptospira ryugenii TaxID=1917863 RepID=A0A2P2E0H4_9LEPT|nr:hypothetical protein [Leptospira ryugenii]GBF50371.1 DinB family protein [Leptospira ryugenii]